MITRSISPYKSNQFLVQVPLATTEYNAANTKKTSRDTNNLQNDSTLQPAYKKLQFSGCFNFMKSTENKAKKALKNGDIFTFNKLKKSLDQTNKILNLQHVDLQHANLQNADLQNVDLRFANLRFAKMQGADLQHADLRNADLRFANLMRADLRKALLRNAKLRNANLEQADFRFADLQNADIRDTNLSGTDFETALLLGIKHNHSQLDKSFEALSKAHLNIDSQISSLIYPDSLHLNPLYLQGVNLTDFVQKKMSGLDI